MADAVGLKKITTKIKTGLRFNKDILLFAFNATGKTRLSRQFENASEEIKSFYYNAIVEDYFKWDNDQNILLFDKDSWLYSCIEEEGFEQDIFHTFQKFIDIKIEPILNFDTGEVKFQIINEKGKKQFIKISKGEETLFKWSVFYSALYHVLNLLTEKVEDRSEHKFDNMKYIIIDDPISSLDEFKLYTLSLQIIDLMKFVHVKQLNITFLICTHHTLFYNILYNFMKKRNTKRKKKSLFYFMEKHDESTELLLFENKGFLAYHIKSLTEIQKAFDDGTINKYHYNMFRSVLEKSSIFLGYSNWRDLFEDYEDADRLTQVVNMNSHERYVELESEFLTQEQISILKNGFDYFKNKYKIKI